MVIPWSCPVLWRIIMTRARMLSTKRYDNILVSLSSVSCNVYFAVIIGLCL